jgi:putative chitinase
MEPLNLTLSQLSFATSTPTARLTEWHGPLTRAMNAASINTPQRAAAFLANVAHECAFFTRFTENLNYTTAERLRRVWPNRFQTVNDAAPFVRNPQGLAEKVYGGRMGNVNLGDGWRFRGRGPFMLTGRANYAAMTDELTQMGVDFNLLGNPDTAAEPEGGSWAAAAFWHKNDMNDLLAAEGFESVRRRVNGGSVGMAECKELYKGALNIMETV